MEPQECTSHAYFGTVAPSILFAWNFMAFIKHCYLSNGHYYDKEQGLDKGVSLVAFNMLLQIPCSETCIHSTEFRTRRVCRIHILRPTFCHGATLPWLQHTCAGTPKLSKICLGHLRGVASLIFEPDPPYFANQYNFWRCTNDISMILVNLRSRPKLKRGFFRGSRSCMI